MGRMVSYLTIRKFARALTVIPVLPGTEGIIGPPKVASTESSTRAAATGASNNHQPLSKSAHDPDQLPETASPALESRP
jgi:hypothetical protein